jgi:hypothetical protein
VPWCDAISTSKLALHPKLWRSAKILRNAT